MDTRTGTSRARASANASSPHGNHGTGLPAWERRYGLAASVRRRFMALSVHLVGVGAHASGPVGLLHRVDRGDLGVGEFEVEDVEVLFQALAADRLREDDEPLLQVPAQHGLRRRLVVR